MAEPTLIEVFGAGATQDVLTLTISKDDLEAVGLTPMAANTAESLLVAIVLLAANVLTESARFADSDNRNVTIEFLANEILTQGINDEFLRRSYALSAYTPFTSDPVDPDDY